MNRIHDTFSALSKQSEKALVGFVTAGDPKISMSLDIITAMCESGVDILELGIPFSDPTSDGPVIQRSSARALAQGVSLRIVLEMTQKIRSKTDVPIILFSYYNPIFVYGSQKFYTDAVDAGADGVLIVDLPPEESDEMTSYWPRQSELALIRLIAPTTPLDRMKTIANDASGFLYMVSKTGVTGSDGLQTDTIDKNTNMLRSVSKLPICVGFGISTREQVAAVASVADGVVIGSAFERTIEEESHNPNLISIISEQVANYKKGTKVDHRKMA